MAVKSKLPVPEAVLDQHIAVLAKTRSGKSSNMRVLVEHLLDAGKPVGIIDPKGDWWGLKLSQDGKKPGYPVVIFGGTHADVPINEHSGAHVAELVATGNRPFIVDLGGWMPGERTRFWVAFASTLFRLTRGLRWLIVDEVHNFCLSEDTEILTRDGFKRHTEIDAGTEAVCFDVQTGRYSFGQIERVIRRQWSGEMVRLQSDGLDSFSTPDHRVVLRRVQRGVGRYKLYDWTFCAADNVPTCVAIPIGGAPIGAGVAGLTPEDARVLGWIATDGGLHPAQTRSPRIMIEQSSATVKNGRSIVGEMDTVLLAIPGVSRYTRKARITVSGGRSRNHAETAAWYFGGESSQRFLRWLGDDIHRIPRHLIENASREQLEALYQGLLEGDGTTNNGRWVNFFPGQCSGLADDFQEIALRLGVSVTKRFVPSINQWHVTIANERKMHWVRRPIREPYDGLVWDVTVPTGAFVARRLGRVFVTGNCPKAGHLDPDAAKALHWTNRLASEGLGKGLHMIFASQRPQKVHNDTLTSAETLLAMRVLHQSDRGAITDWIKGCGDMKKGGEVLESLASLNRGEAWVWSPEAKIGPERVQFPMFRTYDSFKPQPAGVEKELTGWASVDLDEVKAKLAAVVEEAKKNDPAQLRKENARLAKELAAAKRAPGAAGAPAVTQKVVQGPTQEQIDALLAQAEAAARAIGQHAGRVELAKEILVKVKELEALGIKDLALALNRVAAVLEKIANAPEPKVRPLKRQIAPSAGAPRPQAPYTPPSNGHAPVSRRPAQPIEGLAPARQKLLDTLAWLESIGVSPVDKTQLALFASVSPTSGGYFNNLGALRTAGAIDYPQGGTVALTETGRAAAAVPETPATTAELHARIERFLPPAKWRIVDALIKVYPEPIGKDALAEQIGVSPTSGGYFNNLGSLRSLGLIGYPTGGQAVALPVLFLEGR